MRRRVLIGVPLVIGAVAGVLAVVAPNPYPLLLLCLSGLFAAQTASECCPRGREEEIERIFRKLRRRERLRRLAGSIRNR